MAVSKILLVGAGSIGQRHLSNINQVQLDSKVAVVEPWTMRREEVRVRYNVDVFSSIEQALERDDYQVAFVCSPNHLHIKHATKLISAGCHVFIEKPLALNTKEALSFARVVENASTFVMVGCNLRFHPGVTSLKSVLESGAIGRPLYARAQFAHYLPNWRPGQDYRQSYSAKMTEGGGILMDDIHEPDYLYWLLGPVTKVNGSLARLGDLEIDVEDVADYILWHGASCYSHVHSDYLRQDKVRECELVGTEGTVFWKSVGKNPEQVAVSLYTSTTKKWQTVFFEEAYNTNLQYVEEIRYFFECIKTNVYPMNGVREAAVLMDILEHVRSSASDGCLKDIEA